MDFSNFIITGKKSYENYREYRIEAVKRNGKLQITYDIVLYQWPDDQWSGSYIAAGEWLEIEPSVARKMAAYFDLRRKDL